MTFSDFPARLLLSCILLVSMAGCVDPIDLDTGTSQRHLVVEGLLTEGAGPHQVILSRSGAFTEGLDALRPRIQGARVAVETSDGTEVIFQELQSPTRYQSPPGQLVGIVGESYALKIDLPDGSSYRSEPITMLPAMAILSARATLEEGSRLVNGVLISDPSVEVLVDAESVPGEPNYYRWTWSGTHSREACYSTGGPIPQEFCDRCYVSIEGTSLVEIADDAFAVGDVLPNQRAASFGITNHGARFVPAFHVTIEQEALTPDAFQFWSLIRDSRDGVGSLFDPPPEATFSNLVNVDNPDDRPLGYFTVSGSTSTDLCIRRDDFESFPTFPTPPPVQGQCGVTVPGSLTPPPGFEAACARD